MQAVLDDCVGLHVLLLEMVFVVINEIKQNLVFKPLLMKHATSPHSRPSTSHLSMHNSYCMASQGPEDDLDQTKLRNSVSKGPWRMFGFSAVHHFMLVALVK